MTFKTLQEQEREAYITGHVFMADLLALAADAEANAEEDTIANLETDIEDLRTEVDTLEIELADEIERRKALQVELDAK